MMNGHVTEDVIQAILWNVEDVEASAKMHISSCDHCKARVADYQLLFSEIEQIPKPAFDFNLSDLVLTKIIHQGDVGLSPGSVAEIIQGTEKTKSPKNNNTWPWIAFALMLIGLTGTPFLLFRDSVYDIISGVSILVIFLVILIVVLVAGFLFFDECRKYKQQINMLNL